MINPFPLKVWKKSIEVEKMTLTILRKRFKYLGQEVFVVPCGTTEKELLKILGEIIMQSTNVKWQQSWESKCNKAFNRMSQDYKKYHQEMCEIIEKLIQRYPRTSRTDIAFLADLEYMLGMSFPIEEFNEAKQRILKTKNYESLREKRNKFGIISYKRGENDTEYLCATYKLPVINILEFSKQDRNPTNFCPEELVANVEKYNSQSLDKTILNKLCDIATKVIK